jgi:hypothetical protein
MDVAGGLTVVASALGTTDQRLVAPSATGSDRWLKPGLFLRSGCTDRRWHPAPKAHSRPPRSPRRRNATAAAPACGVASPARRRGLAPTHRASRRDARPVRHGQGRRRDAGSSPRPRPQIRSTLRPRGTGPFAGKAGCAVCLDDLEDVCPRHEPRLGSRHDDRRRQDDGAVGFDFSEVPLVGSERLQAGSGPRVEFDERHTAHCTACITGASPLIRRWSLLVDPRDAQAGCGALGGSVVSPHDAELCQEPREAVGSYPQGTLGRDRGRRARTPVRRAARRTRRFLKRSR